MDRRGRRGSGEIKNREQTVRISVNVGKCERDCKDSGYASFSDQFSLRVRLVTDLCVCGPRAAVLRFCCCV